MWGEAAGCPRILALDKAHGRGWPAGRLATPEPRPIPGFSGPRGAPLSSARPGATPPGSRGYGRGPVLHASGEWALSPAFPGGSEAVCWGQEGAASVLSVCWVLRLCCHLIFSTTLGRRYRFYPHLREEETEAQRGIGHLPKVRCVVSGSIRI